MCDGSDCRAAVCSMQLGQSAVLSVIRQVARVVDRLNQRDSVQECKTKILCYEATTCPGTLAFAIVLVVLFVQEGAELSALIHTDELHARCRQC